MKEEKTVFVAEVRVYDCEMNRYSVRGYAIITEDDIESIEKTYCHSKNIPVKIKKESIYKIESQTGVNLVDYTERVVVLCVDDIKRIKNELESEIVAIKHKLKAFNTFAKRYNL